MRGTTNIPSVYVLLRKNGKVAFLKRANTGYKDGTFALPSGHVEAGESFRQAAVRETWEEVGVRVSPNELRQIYTMQRNEGVDNIRVDVFFEATA